MNGFDFAALLRRIAAAAGTTGGAAATFLLVHLLLFSRGLLSGMYIAPSDALDFGVAAFLSPIMMWSDGMFAGFPAAAAPQSLTWYPPLRLLAAAGVGWNLFMVLPYAIAGFTCFLLVRHLSGSRAGGFFAGLTYSLSGTLLAHLGHFNQIHVAAWVPLLFFGVALAADGRRSAGVIVGSLAVCMMTLAGHPQLLVYASYLAAGYTAFRCTQLGRTRSDALRLLAAAAVMFALGVGMAAVQVLPTLELATFTGRSEPNWNLYTDKPFPARQLVTVAFPLLYGGLRPDRNVQVEYFGDNTPMEMTGYAGLLPVLLALVYGWRLRNRRAEGRFWTVAAIIAATLALGPATPLANVFFHAPGYSSFRVPARHLFLVVLGIAVVAGLVVSELIERRRQRSADPRIAVGAAIGLLGLLGAWAGFSAPIRHAAATQGVYVVLAIVFPVVLLASSLAALILAPRLRPARRAWLLAALLVLDLVPFQYIRQGDQLQFATIIEGEVRLDPQLEPYRAELIESGTRILAADGVQNEFLRPNLTRAWQVPAASGASPLKLARYSTMTGIGGPGNIRPESLEASHLALDLLAVRYALIPSSWPIAAAIALENQPRWEPVRSFQHPDAAYLLARNRRAFPPAWLTRRARISEDAATTVAIEGSRLPNGAHFNPRQLALVPPEHAEAVGNVAGNAGPCGRVRPSERAPGRRAYAVEARRPCLLVASEIWYPWWRATVNGQPADVVRVDLALAGVVIAAGQSDVVLRIVPTSVYAGGLISVGALAIWSALTLRLRRRGRQRVRSADSSL